MTLGKVIALEVAVLLLYWIIVWAAFRPRRRVLIQHPSYFQGWKSRVSNFKDWRR